MLKILNKRTLVERNQVPHACNERTILRAVDHPLIVKLWDAFQDNVNLYMVLEYVPGGELFTLLQRSPNRVRGIAVFLRGMLTSSTVTALPRACRKILRCRSRYCAKISSFTRYCLSRSRSRNDHTDNRLSEFYARMCCLGRCKGVFTKGVAACWNSLL